MLVMGLPLQDRLSASQPQNQLGQSGGIVASTALDVKRLVSSAISLYVTLAAGRFGDNIGASAAGQAIGPTLVIIQSPQKHRAGVTSTSLVTSAAAAIRSGVDYFPHFPSAGCNSVTLKSGFGRLVPSSVLGIALRSPTNLTDCPTYES